MVTVWAMITILFIPSVLAFSVVNLGQIVKLSEEDLGLEGASVSPDGEIAIAFGVEAQLFLIDTSAPANFSEIFWDGENDFMDASFHVGGKTALIVGEDGEILRFSRSSNSVEDAGGDVFFGETDLRSVSWNGDGSWAYVGGEMGWLWRVRGLESGGMEAHLIDGSGSSDVNGIACLQSFNSCVIATSVDGVGIIDADHRVHWIGGTGYPWIDVECPERNGNQCVAISSERDIAVIELNNFDASASEFGIVQLPDLDGRFNGIATQSESRTLISMAPFAIIEHDLVPRKSFPWLENSDVVDFSSEISGEIIVSTWGLGETNGWLLTDSGTIVEFGLEDERESPGILGIWIGIVVLGGMVLVVTSLLASSSPTIGRWLTFRIGSEEEKKDAKREQRIQKGNRRSNTKRRR